MLNSQWKVRERIYSKQTTPGCMWLLGKRLEEDFSKSTLRDYLLMEISQ